VIAKMDEELSGSCTVEIAAFNEFVALLADPATVNAFDHIVFDTAPTGHTLRLLTLPGAWTGFLKTSTAGVTCIGPVSALGQAQEQYGEAVTALRDPARTTVVLVTRPEASGLAEAARAAGELAGLGLAHQRLIINGVFTATDTAASDPVATAWGDRARLALAAMPAQLARLGEIDTIPLLPISPVGLSGLRVLLDPERSKRTHTLDDQDVAAFESSPAIEEGLTRLVDDIEASGPGIVMTMGKGGVGKTTIAAAIALALAARGHQVTLTTTDPAAHVHDVLPDPPDNLDVTRIDPVAETARYTATVLAEAGQSLSPEAYELLEEDLRSPCTEEVAVFRAFAHTVADTHPDTHPGADQDSGGRFVVIDTAPTGHTLLLLDSSRSFTRQLACGPGAADDPAANLLRTLRDASRTRIVLVTLPEATPVHEASRLHDDLARARITVFGWVINASLAATGTQDPLLRARGVQERRWVAEAAAHSARPAAVIAWAPEPPTGTDRLTALTTGGAAQDRLTHDSTTQTACRRDLP
jgi:arsenite-transporting ATPase